MSLASLLNDTFTITRSSGSTLGADGRPVAASTSVTNPFKGRLSPIGGRVTASAAADKTKVSHKLYCQTSVDIGEGDKVTMTARGEVLKVLVVIEPSVRGHHLQVDCEQLRPNSRS